MIDSLPTSVEELRALVVKLMRRTDDLETENSALKKKIVELEKKLAKNKIDPPPVVRPNTPPSSKQQQRRHRLAAFVRRRSVPDKIVIHAYTQCPECKTPVCGTSLAYEREIIDLPPVVTPVVTLHRVLKRHCTHCGSWVTPKVDWSHLVVGHSRFGVGVMSVVTTLREYGRLPVRVVQRLFSALYGLSLSLGEIIGLSHRVAIRGSPTYQQLHTKLLAAACINADETNHRENGQSGYIWNFTTPTIRYYAYRLTSTSTTFD
mgnify:CR=1 FL=1